MGNKEQGRARSNWRRCCNVINVTFFRSSANKEMRHGGYSQSCDILPELRDKYAQNDDCVTRIHRQ